VAAFVEDLRAGAFRAGFRIKGVRRAPDVFELTWDGVGRATWSDGVPVAPGEQHLVWRRIGGHDIFDVP
jgi:hypothetical protein